MPYARNSDLPKSIRDALPTEAQTIFRRIFNAALEQYKDESKAFAVAWAGLKNAGWEKRGDKWVKVEKDFSRSFNIEKKDDERRLVFGWSYIAYDANGEQIVDKQGDMMDEEDLEDMAYDFVLYSREGGEMHVRGGVAKLVESMVFTKEKQRALGIPEGVVPIGHWVGFRIEDDEVWKKVKSGEYSAFSIEGVANREEVD